MIHVCHILVIIELATGKDF